MSQLGLPAISLLQRATATTIDIPHSAPAYGLLITEFFNVVVPSCLFTPFIPASDSYESKARRCLKRTAYFNFVPTQYKLGHIYELAQLLFPFDPVTLGVTQLARLRQVRLVLQKQCELCTRLPRARDEPEREGRDVSL